MGKKADNWKEALAQKLLDARGSESRVKVAARCGVGDKTIIRIERKEVLRSPRAETLARLALGLGEDVEEWLLLTGHRMLPSQIDRLRQEVTIHKLLRKDELEPAAQIKAEVREYVDTKIQELEERVTRNLRAYIDGRFAEFRKRFNDSV